MTRVTHMGMRRSPKSWAHVRFLGAHVGFAVGSTMGWAMGDANSVVLRTSARRRSLARCPLRHSLHPLGHGNAYPYAASSR